ncbi:hypothetical protein BE221DRAFT_83770, partial [Ostreococcus tauri]
RIRSTFLGSGVIIVLGDAATHRDGRRVRALDESRQLDEAFEMNEKSADCSEAMNGILHNLQIVVYGGREPLSRVDEITQEFMVYSCTPQKRNFHPLTHLTKTA